MNKLVVKIAFILINLSMFSSCITDKKTTFYVKNETADTVLLDLSQVDTLAEWECWGGQIENSGWLNSTDGENKLYIALIGSLALPDSMIYVSPDVFRSTDTCYVYAVKWNIAKRFSLETIRERKLYDRRVVTENDFHNRLFEYR